MHDSLLARTRLPSIVLHSQLNVIIQPITLIQIFRLFQAGILSSFTLQPSIYSVNSISCCQHILTIIIIIIIISFCL